MESGVLKPSRLACKLPVSPKSSLAFCNMNFNGSWLGLPSYSPKKTRLNSIPNFIPFTSSVNKRRKDNDVLSLDTIRNTFHNREGPLIFCLLQRSRFAYNPNAYDCNGILVDSFHCSLVEYLARNHDKLYAMLGGYKSPSCQLPFFPENLPEPLTWSFLPPIYTKVLHPSTALINKNKAVWKMYFDSLLPRIANKDSDRKLAYSSALKCAEWDLNCLQGLSKRIHFGKFVAEAAFLEDPEKYEPAIRAKDHDRLNELLTDEKLEKSDLDRVKKLAASIGDVNGDDASPLYNISSSLVAELYSTWIMPLTKEVEVQYLLKRLD